MTATPDAFAQQLQAVAAQMRLMPQDSWTLAPPKEFNGKKEDFEEFQYRLRAYVILNDVSFEKELDHLENNPETVIHDGFTDQSGNVLHDELRRSKKLQYLLTSLVSGAAQHVIRRGTSTNGYESYRQLILKYKIAPRQRAMGRLTNILKPNFKSGSFEDALTKWEDEVNKYEKETGSTTFK